MVVAIRRHTATSDEETAGWAYPTIPINAWVELFRVNGWCDGVPWKKFTLGIVDAGGSDYGLKDGYSLQTHALRWEAKTRFIEFIKSVKFTIQTPIAAEIYVIKAVYIPTDARIGRNA